MSLTVLVVEDHVESADGLVELLRLWGHRAHAAYDGESAVEVRGALRPDVVLVDIGLPGMDGNALACRLREDDAGLLLIALTGYGDATAVDPEFDDRLEKPVPLDVLQALLADRAHRGDD
jgi:CheY-like chemotaxis protein